MRSPVTPAPAGQRVDRECPLCLTTAGDRPFCPRDGALLEPFDLNDRYRVDELIGAGGMAFVFGARHSILGKAVAVKVLRPELAAKATDARRFVREAQNASQIRHDNVVDISDFGYDGALDVWYLVMERLTGTTLAGALRDGGPMPWARAVPILLQLARGLHAAHAAGVVHRDLNPANVFLTESSGRRDVVKLCDFGLSRLASGADRVTTTGVFVGTPAYMAPEQIRGEVALDHRVDLYALGVTAYEMLSGTLPHRGLTPVGLIASKLADGPTPLREQLGDAAVPVELDELIMRCLAHRPDDRPQSAAEVESALVRLVRHQTVEVAASTEIIGQVAGSYRITRLIGTGGAGSVYLAEHPVLRTRVAVKVLLPEFAAVPVMVKRFVQEAQTASALGSPHIPRYFDFGYLPSGQPFAIMEYLEGESLADSLARRGPLPVAETAGIVEQVARAIAQAHAAGIIHRDLKPENLFLAADGTVKLLDFGIAVLIGPGGAQARMTAPGLLMGTPYYCAPEQIAGGEATRAADIYALGVTAFEMLCGRCPFEGDIAEVLAGKTTREAPRVRELRIDVPAPVAAMIERMLARDPAARPASMAEVADSAATWGAAAATAASEPAVGVRVRGAVEVGRRRARGAAAWLRQRSRAVGAWALFAAAAAGSYGVARTAGGEPERVVVPAQAPSIGGEVVVAPDAAPVVEPVPAAPVVTDVPELPPAPDAIAERAAVVASEPRRVQAPERSRAKTPATVPERAPRRAPENAPPKTAEKAPPKTAEKAPSKSPEKSPPKSPERAPSKSPEKSPEKSPPSGAKRRPAPIIVDPLGDERPPGTIIADPFD